MRLARRKSPACAVSRPLIAAAGTSVGASLQASCARASAALGSRSIASSAIAVLITARQRFAVGLSMRRGPGFEATGAGAGGGGARARAHPFGRPAGGPPGAPPPEARPEKADAMRFVMIEHGVIG